mmetsp:Transcript_12253/g.35558  ORF Transcript_12253/g.35558 Transcript_12253/m.35558 type:complete len:248 (+) Transcript_12253:228-971(+)
MPFSSFGRMASSDMLPTSLNVFSLRTRALAGNPDWRTNASSMRLHVNVAFPVARATCRDTSHPIRSDNGGGDGSFLSSSSFDFTCCSCHKRIPSMFWRCRAQKIAFSRISRTNVWQPSDSNARTLSCSAFSSLLHVNTGFDMSADDLVPVCNCCCCNRLRSARRTRANAARDEQMLVLLQFFRNEMESSLPTLTTGSIFVVAASFSSSPFSVTGTSLYNNFFCSSFKSISEEVPNNFPVVFQSTMVA